MCDHTVILLRFKHNLWSAVHKEMQNSRANNIKNFKIETAERYTKYRVLLRVGSVCSCTGCALIKITLNTTNKYTENGFIP